MIPILEELLVPLKERITRHKTTISASINSARLTALGSGFPEQVEVVVVGGRDQLFNALGGVLSGSACCKACGSRPQGASSGDTYRRGGSREREVGETYAEGLLVFPPT